MNKTELKNFAISARRSLLKKVALRAKIFGIDDKKGLTIEEKFGQLAINGETYSLDKKTAFQSLKKQLETKGYEQLIEEVAYTWFNRIIAIRYMEVNDYLPERVNVLSSSTGKVEPDILSEYETMELDIDHLEVKELIRHGETESAFRMLFIAQCNTLNKIMPFMFEKIQDYTELLLPDFLLDSEFIINKLVSNDALTESFTEIEVMGWLYQYYNTEPKDKVFSNLKKNKKIEKYDIPAATQIFTPKWIVQYMLENSLGQLWLESNPNSLIKQSMRYYIEPEEQDENVKRKLEKIRYRNVNPEEITFIDPCCGSGHILVYAFDLFYQMYEEAGYPSGDIPKLILEKNLFGLDIDDRAAQLASFALLMKARQKSSRIYKKQIGINVYAIQESNHMDKEGLTQLIGRNNLEQETVRLVIDTFYNAKDYGTIINLTNVNLSSLIESLDSLGEIQLTVETFQAFEQISDFRKLLKQAQILIHKYDVMVTNPPYMGASGMNSSLSSYVKEHYDDAKSDLSTVFMKRAINFLKPNGFEAMINIPSWMFLSSFERMRFFLISNLTVHNLLHLGRGIFGADFGTVSFIMRNSKIDHYIGTYKRLFDKQSEVDTLAEKERKFFDLNRNYYKDQNEFLNIKGRPFAYWLSNKTIKIFKNAKSLEDVSDAVTKGIFTGKNDYFIRFWYEINHTLIYKKGWNKYTKGGAFRKWWGNVDYVLKWYNNGKELKGFPGSGMGASKYFGKDFVCWSKITISMISFRYCDGDVFFDDGSPAIISAPKILIGFLNTKVARYFLSVLSPSINAQIGEIKKLPINFTVDGNDEKINLIIDECILISKTDWDSYETSIDFKYNPLIQMKEENGLLSFANQRWKTFTETQFNQLKANEEELNRIFISLYDLEDELIPEIPDEEVTIRKANQTFDVKSFLSYFIGCIMGRYSLDMEGLAYAGGEWEDFKFKTFLPNKFGLIQLTDEHYFEDDIIARLREFLSVTFGKDTVEENLLWLADSLELKRNESPEERLRRYFLDEFFNDHCQVYQKRPIYWLVDSGKQKGLRTLIYMHRYQPDTMATIRFEHLQEIQAKYNNEIATVDIRMVNPNLSATEKREHEKRKSIYQKRLEELLEFDKKLAEYANAQTAIDLDDGVKFNYSKFENVLAKIK